jgi:hypothetical protein
MNRNLDVLTRTSIELFRELWQSDGEGGGLGHLSERRKGVDDHTHPFLSDLPFDFRDVCSATQDIQSVGL